MEYRNLGRTGLKVSACGLGCGNFGGIGRALHLVGKGISEPDAFALMDHGWEMGINFFDTADSYGGGFSETYIGKWLKTKDSRIKDQIVLSSKVFNPMGEGPNQRGLSRIHIYRQIEKSLTKLGTDHLDMYLIHEPDCNTPLEETLVVLNDLIHEGKVRYIGASNMPAWLMARSLWISDAHNLRRFEWVQNSFSLMDQFDELEMFPLCADQRLGCTPFSPLAGGWLTGKYRAGEPFPPGSRMALTPELYPDYQSEKTFTALEDLRSYARERGCDMTTLALAWVMNHPFVTAPIIGPRRWEHLREVKQALAMKIDKGEQEQLARIFSGFINSYYHGPFYTNI